MSNATSPMKIVVNRLMVKYIPQPSPDGLAIAAVTNILK
jgi:hypothetical protein